jgi:predicted nucleotide-binding protein
MDKKTKKQKLDLLNELISRTKELKFNDEKSLDSIRKDSKMVINHICETPDEYISSLNGIWFHPMMEPSTSQYRNEAWNDGKDELLNLLSTIKREIVLFYDDGTSKNENEINSGSGIEAKSKKIFIVHGHDDAMKQEVARFISSLNLDPIILNEQPDHGLTIIEKFEQNTLSCQFAVVLLSPDDYGFPKGKESNKQLRARQNVIFELGFFVGKISRRNVISLIKNDPTGDLEIPTDFSGVIYEQFDKSGGWKLKLAKQLRANGYEIDIAGLLD